MTPRLSLDLLNTIPDSRGQRDDRLADLAGLQRWLTQASSGGRSRYPVATRSLEALAELARRSEDTWRISPRRGGAPGSPPTPCCVGDAADPPSRRAGPRRHSCRRCRPVSGMGARDELRRVEPAWHRAGPPMRPPRVRPVLLRHRPPPRQPLRVCLPRRAPHVGGDRVSAS